MSKIILLLVTAALLGGCQTVGAQPSTFTHYYEVSYYKQGVRTSSGERFDKYGDTAAHKRLPFGTELRLTNPANGRTTHVKINDRGPFVAGRDLDVTLGVAIKLGFVDRGHARLSVDIIKLGE